MSFYASDSIKDIISDDHLADDHDQERVASKFDIVFSDGQNEYFSKMTKITARPEGDYIVLTEINNQMIEKIFFNKVSASEIFIGSKSRKVKSSTFLEAVHLSDQYMIKVLIDVRN